MGYHVCAGVCAPAVMRVRSVQGQVCTQGSVCAHGAVVHPWGCTRLAYVCMGLSCVSSSSCAVTGVLGVGGSRAPPKLGRIGPQAVLQAVPSTDPVPRQLSPRG